MKPDVVLALSQLNQIDTMMRRDDQRPQTGYDRHDDLLYKRDQLFNFIKWMTGESPQWTEAGYTLEDKEEERNI